MDAVLLGEMWIAICIGMSLSATLAVAYRMWNWDTVDGDYEWRTESTYGDRILGKV